MKVTHNIKLLGVAAYATAFFGYAQADNTPTVWVAPSLHRVAMSEQPGASSQANLFAARGEYESFQIVASGGTRGLRNVNVTVSDLTGPGGSVIARTNLTLYREKYQQVTS